MLRTQLLEMLINKHGADAELPKTYAELFTLGELLKMVSEQEQPEVGPVVLEPFNPSFALLAA